MTRKTRFFALHCFAPEAEIIFVAMYMRKNVGTTDEYLGPYATTLLLVLRQRAQLINGPL